MKNKNTEQRRREIIEEYQNIIEDRINNISVSPAREIGLIIEYTEITGGLHIQSDEIYGEVRARKTNERNAAIKEKWNKWAEDIISKTKKPVMAQI